MHELTEKVWTNGGIKLEVDSIIRQWLGEKAKEFNCNFPGNLEHLSKILGLEPKERTLEEKFKEYSTTSGDIFIRDNAHKLAAIATAHFSKES